MPLTPPKSWKPQQVLWGQRRLERYTHWSGSWQGSKTITIKDKGIGMTAEEIEKYITQIAFSGAEEFVNKLQKG